MSAPADLPDATTDLVLDPGVLIAASTLEVQGFAAVSRTGGLALLPWRAQARAAQAAGVAFLPAWNQPAWHSGGGVDFVQAVVRIGKGRAATEADLAQAWSALSPAGRLLIVGGNDIGITTWAKRVAERTGDAGQLLVNRARGRVVAFARNDRVLETPSPTVVPLPDGTPLQVAPGVFSGDGLDGGTALMLEVLAEEAHAGAPAPRTVVDVGCGAGHLGLAAARQWPNAQVWLLDADHRAVTCAARNALAVEPALPGESVRIHVAWWDEQDPWPVPDADLAVLNPPWHAGTAPDVSSARRLFAVSNARRLLVVANRHLPYEQDARALGALRVRADNGRFKVLEITR